MEVSDITEASSEIEDGFSRATQQTPEELVARAIAPIKRDFLRPPPPSGTTQNEKEKKSKRERLLFTISSEAHLISCSKKNEQKYALNLCPEIAKTGEINACSYKEKCRFGHDIQAFMAQKPPDLEGECPFTNANAPCPFGLACRFAGTHKDGASAATTNVLKERSEVNGLNKDIQKLLWTKKLRFTKADDVVKSLGLTGPNWNIKKRVGKEEGVVSIYDFYAARETESEKVADEVGSSECSTFSTEEEANEEYVTDEFRPSKKAKSVVHKSCFWMFPGAKKIIDFRGKLYLAPLTTVGNLPFRRVCKIFGADVTCSEMAMCTDLLQGKASEWALLRRHSSEDLFGVQICGVHADTVARTVELIEKACTVDFIDINMGCPADILVKKGAGFYLPTEPLRVKGIIQAASRTADKPITVKVRTGDFVGKNRIDSLLADIGRWDTNAVTIHGRSHADWWNYIYYRARKAPSTVQVLGNGDIFSYLDWNNHISDCPELSTCMIARGALIKPWLFTEIKEQRHWDISSGERLNILKDYVRFGLEHWGSDQKGVETTRNFLLEWLRYTCRYIPVGLLDVIPQRLNWRHPSYGRDDLETLMASDSVADWIRISEMLLGKVPDGFSFEPMNKSNAFGCVGKG